jgi:hypothetical protein
MPKKPEKKLYDKLRAAGVRKKSAKVASQTATKLDGKGRVPMALKGAIGDLRGALDQLEGQVEAHERKAAGRKAARTRKRKAEERSAVAQKATRKRAKTTM